MTIEFWHNPRCSKSRQALALLKEHDAEVSVVEYLVEAPSRARLAEVAGLVGGASKLVRRKEAAFKEARLQDATDDALLDAMAKAPKLIERPVAIAAGRAVIGRPPEAVLELLELAKPSK